MLKRILIAMLLIVTLCSCGGKTPSKEQIDTPQEAYHPVQGGTLRVYSYNADTLNPIFTQNNANSNMLKLIFEPLVWCGNDMKPNPMLAISWSGSADNLIWTVNLRDDVKFHDGSALTADDVVSSLKAAQSAQSIYHTNLKDVADISGSGNSVRIRLARPVVNFINLLEIPIIKASKQSIIEGFYPIGTGPYSYSEQQNNKIILLSANRSWWGENPPYMDNVEVHLLPDKNTATFAYDAKQIDAVMTDTVSAGKYIGNKDSKVLYSNSSNFVFLGFNYESKMFSNPQLRKAVAYAINKQKLNEQVLLSKANVTDTFINPAWYMYSEDVEKYNYDLDQTKALLSQEGYEKKPLTFELLVCKDNEIKNNIADFMEQSLESAGISVNVKRVGWDEYISLLNKHSYDAFIGEFAFSANVDPSFMLLSTEAKNYFQYKNPEMDNLLVNWMHSSSEGEQLQGYHDIQKLYAQDLPFVSLYYSQNALLLNKKVKGQIDPIYNNMFYNINKWYLDEKGVDKP